MGKKTELDEDFLTIISYIEETCYSQKFEGAAADFFNSNIIARDLGLVDKKQLDVPKTIKYKNVSKEYPKEKP